VKKYCVDHAFRRAFHARDKFSGHRTGFIADRPKHEVFELDARGKRPDGNRRIRGEEARNKRIDERHTDAFRHELAHRKRRCGLAADHWSRSIGGEEALQAHAQRSSRPGGNHRFSDHIGHPHVARPGEPMTAGHNHE
jgi:hypothetical protein